VPEDGETGVRVIRARIICVQRAAVTQLQIGLRNHALSLRAVPLFFVPELPRSFLPHAREQSTSA
jgi:hypothetical protein